MINTRQAITNDEAWMLEKLSRENAKHDSFRPEDFIVALDAETEERIGFGCIKYHRNIADDTEYVEIGDFVVLDWASKQQGCLLLNELVKKAKEGGNDQVFAFPHKYHELFEEVGFEKREIDELPDVMNEVITEKEELHTEEHIQPYSEQPKNIEYIIEKSDEFVKPEGTSENEIESIKEDLDIDDKTTTKYSVN